MTYPEQSTYTAAQVRAIAYMCGGAGAGAVMSEHPRAVMPSALVVQMVEAILTEFGVPLDHGAPPIINGSPEIAEVEP